MTNAEIIRAMSDEALAEYIAGMILDVRNGLTFSGDSDAWLKWLRTEVQEVYEKKA